MALTAPHFIISCTVAWIIPILEVPYFSPASLIAIFCPLDVASMISRAASQTFDFPADFIMSGETPSGLTQIDEKHGENTQ